MAKAVKLIKKLASVLKAVTFTVLCLSVLIGCSNQSGKNKPNLDNHDVAEHSTNADHERVDDDSFIADNNASFNGLVVTNHPLYMLAVEATRGIETPRAILPKGEAGHHHAMSPSSRKLIEDARVIYWFGASMEAPLAPLLSSLSKPNESATANHASGLHDAQRKVVGLLNQPTLKVLPMRDAQKQPIAGTSDPHLWLDPKRAVLIVELIAKEQSKLHPEHADAYKRNVDIFRQKVTALLKSVRPSLVKNMPYVSYHDAYQYLEPELNMHYLGSIVKSPELPMQPKHLLKLKAAKQAMTVDGAELTVCILSENQGIEARIEALKPFKLLYIKPNMSEYEDYIGAWRAISQKISSCSASDSPVSIK